VLIIGFADKIAICDNQTHLVAMVEATECEHSDSDRDYREVDIISRA